MKVQAAALSLGGRNFVVTVTSEQLLASGERDMVIETLEGGFGGVPVVLLAQLADGTPRYYGDRDLVELLRGVPVDRMPFKEYDVG